MISKELTAAAAKPLVLAILAQGESYGYEIIQRVREMSGGQMEWKDGMLYPVLHRLERNGLVEAKWGESETGRRRRYYRLVKAGRTELAAERKQWTTVHDVLSRSWEQKLCLS